MINSLVVVGVSSLAMMLLAVPAALALSIGPIKKSRDVVFLAISTKLLPIVDAIATLPVVIAGWRRRNE
jgi:sorbitol/mannitol transport system permease protein